MSTSMTIKNKFKKTSVAKTIKDDDTIDALWVMGGASVIHDENNNTNIVGYACYCDACKKKSSSGNGGIVFTTAEELLDHRNMKAFKCPAGCGFHVCPERGSIIRHLKKFHEEIHATLEKKGLDPKKSWIIPDEANNTYTLDTDKPKANSKPIANPKPDFEDKSPLEQGAIILSLTPPKRVFVPPSPVPADSPIPFSKKNEFSPINTKSWGNIKKTVFKPLNEVMTEQQNEDDETEETPIHYAQEDMRKEKQCSHGIHCIKKDRPFACPYNHDSNGDIIKKGTVLTEDVLCQYERPPFMRCHDSRCIKIHLEHRAEFIEKKKKSYFENNEKQETITNIKTEVAQEPIVSSVISISNEGINIVLSAEDAIAVATAQNKLDGTNIQLEVEEPWISPRKNKKNKKQQIEEDDDTDDSTHELRNIHSVITALEC
jgi:hypothetical protein